MADLADSGGVRPGTTQFVYNNKGKDKGKGKFTATPDEVAQQFGFKLVFINSDPELKAAFSAFMDNYVAMKGKVSQATFDLMMDQWADTKGFTQSFMEDRKLELEQPEDWEQSVQADVQILRDYAEQIGASMSDAELRQAAIQSRRMGMNQNQKLRLVEGYVNAVYSDGALDFGGDAGVSQDDIVEWAYNNGIKLSDNMISQYVSKVATGELTLDEIKSDIRRTYMAGAFPAWGEQIGAGMDIADIAAPYKATLAQLLEVDENAIDFNDPLMLAGLQSVGQDGKPRVMPLYEYQNLVRKDPRWQKTDNAYATYSNVANGILRTFGFA